MLEWVALDDAVAVHALVDLLVHVQQRLHVGAFQELLQGRPELVDLAPPRSGDVGLGIELVPPLVDVLRAWHCHLV